MAIEQDLITYLEANTAGIEFALDEAMSDAATPFCEVTVDNDITVRTTKGSQPTSQVELELEVFALNSASAKSSADVIIALLREFSGVMGSSTVMRSRIFNERSGRDSAADVSYRSFTVQFSYR